MLFIVFIVAQLIVAAATHQDFATTLNNNNDNNSNSSYLPLYGDHGAVCKGSGFQLQTGSYNASWCNLTAWTMRDLWHDSRQVLSPTGFTQAVTNVNIGPNTGAALWPPVSAISPSCPVIKQGPNGAPAPGSPFGSGFLGTGHGGEFVYSLILTVATGTTNVDIGTYDLLGDGRAPSLPAGGKTQWPANSLLRVRKQSQLGALLADQTVLLHPTRGITVSANFTLAYDAPPSQLNWLYPAMTMWEVQHERWVAMAANGTLLGPFPFRLDGSFALHADILWMAVWKDGSSEHASRGAVYYYPAAYNGSGTFKNSIWERSHDHKLYLRVDPCRVKGCSFEICHAVQAFAATNTTWVQVAQGLVRDLPLPCPGCPPLQDEELGH